MEAFALSDKGGREHNEDAFLIDETQSLFIVADGVGGYGAGDVASTLCCRAIKQAVAQGQSLQEALQTANDALLNASREKNITRMATTVVVIRLHKAGYEIAWVGDSRLYLWDGHLKCLTKDHSYVQSLIDAGTLCEEDRNQHPKRNLITQAIGGSAQQLLAGHNKGSLSPGATLMLCSDGVHGELHNAQLATLLSSVATLPEIAERIIDNATQQTHADNATCLLIRPEVGFRLLPGKRPQVYFEYGSGINRVPDQNRKTLYATSIIILLAAVLSVITIAAVV